MEKEDQKDGGCGADIRQRYSVHVRIKKLHLSFRALAHIGKLERLYYPQYQQNQQ